MKRYASSLTIATLPVIVSAQTIGGTAPKQLVVNFINVIVEPLLTLLFAIALLYFFWGLFKLMQDLVNGGEGAEGKQHTLWGTVGMLIMFSVWGILNLVASSVGVDTSGMIQGVGGFK